MMTGAIGRLRQPPMQDSVVIEDLRFAKDDRSCTSSRCITELHVDEPVVSLLLNYFAIKRRGLLTLLSKAFCWSLFENLLGYPQILVWCMASMIWRSGSTLLVDCRFENNLATDWYQLI